MTRRSFVPTLAALAPAALAAQSRPPKGKLKQSVTRGCFRQPQRQWTLDEMCRHAAELGFQGFDLIGPADFPLLKKYGLVPTMVPGAMSIADGIITRENHAAMENKLRDLIDAAAAAGAPNVIALSGNRRGMSDEQGIENSVLFFNRIKKHVEDKGVAICLELLNSKVNHPDYMCDRTRWGVEVMRRVNSPRVKLLYDIYHMQIMEGDIIRTIRDNFQYLAHFHTAGNPGRHEMDDTQEMNYRGIARALAELNFTGYIAHEYTPLGDPLQALEQARKIFEV